MSPVLSNCPNCGTFTSSVIDVESSSDVTIGGIKETCPRCGATAEVYPGTFNFDAQGLATVLTGPGWTRAAYAQAQQALLRTGRALKAGQDKDEALQSLAREVDGIFPRAGAALWAALGKQQVANIIALLAFMATVIIPLITDNGISEDEARRMIDEAIAKHESSASTVTPAEPLNHEQVEDHQQDAGDNEPKR